MTDDIIPFAARDAQEDENLGLITRRDAVNDLRRMQKLPRFPTPFPSLTTALGLDGWMVGQSYVLVGGTGVGKTTFTLDCAAHQARHYGPVLYGSEEMRPGHCLTRAGAGPLGVTSNDLIRGVAEFTDDELEETLPEAFYFTRRVPLAQLRKQVKFLRKKYGKPVFLVVDYLQKLAAQVAKEMQAAGEKPDLRQATTHASSILCTIAEEDEATVLAVSSGGRSSAAKLRGSRGGRFIDVRDIPPSELVDTAKESGDVEYDAAGLITLSVSSDLDVDNYQVATMTVAKARYGRVQHIAMAYDGERGVWHDRGRVEPRKKDDPERDEQLTAERIASLNEIAVKAFDWLERAPLSFEGLRRNMHKARSDIELALAPFIRDGSIVVAGQGRSRKLKLVGSRSLPGLGGGAT